jgi:L-2-hydroxyglutarate oxidase LhgO
LGGRGRQISEFKASLVYKVSSRTARAIQRNPVSKNKKQKTNKQTKLVFAGAGEMAQQLRALTTLPEVLSSNPSKHMVVHNHL